MAADVQGRRSALQAARDEPAAARSQDRSQLEEERARTQQMAADVQGLRSALQAALDVAADVQGLRSALQAALDEPAAARSQDQSQLEEERARAVWRRCRNSGTLQRSAANPASACRGTCRSSCRGCCTSALTPTVRRRVSSRGGTAVV
eukprot:EG_transcript_26547